MPRLNKGSFTLKHENLVLGLRIIKQSKRLQYCVGLGIVVPDANASLGRSLPLLRLKAAQRWKLAVTRLQNTTPAAYLKYFFYSEAHLRYQDRL